MPFSVTVEPGTTVVAADTDADAQTQHHTNSLKELITLKQPSRRRLRQLALTQPANLMEGRSMRHRDRACTHD
jgi:hypothetical protein